MTNIEMFARLGSMPMSEIDAIRQMIRDGYGARGIALETNIELRQINAIFKWHDELAKDEAKVAAVKAAREAANK